MIHYVYITTNIITGQQYVGDRSCKNILKDLYLGSGTYLKNSIKKYGKENFSKRVINTFDTRQEAYEAQEKYINEYTTLVPCGYNISIKGGYGIYESPLNKLTKQKISQSLKNHSVSENTKQKISNAKKGKHITEKHKNNIAIANTFKTYYQTNEFKKKISIANTGKKHSEEHNKKISKSNKGLIPSEETRKKRSISMLGKNTYKRSEETKQKMKISQQKRRFNENRK